MDLHNSVFSVQLMVNVAAWLFWTTLLELRPNYIFLSGMETLFCKLYSYMMTCVTAFAPDVFLNQNHQMADKVYSKKNSSHEVIHTSAWLYDYEVYTNYRQAVLLQVLVLRDSQVLIILQFPHPLPGWK